MNDLDDLKRIANRHGWYVLEIRTDCGGRFTVIRNLEETENLLKNPRISVKIILEPEGK